MQFGALDTYPDADPELKRQQREQLARDVRAFLQAGGTIQVLPPYTESEPGSYARQAHHESSEFNG